MRTRSLSGLPLSFPYQAVEEVSRARRRSLIRRLCGCRRPSLPVDQLLLGQEEVEQVETEGLAAEEAADPAKLEARIRKRRANLGSLPA